MTDNERIAAWAGFKRTRYDGPNGTSYKSAPKYTTSDADAITLLPVLVGRGYYVELCSNSNGNGQWLFSINTYDDLCGWELLIQELKPTISAAISSAVLQLIEKEEKDAVLR